MKLGELIDYLKSQDPNRVLAKGFGAPHSYRGYYEDLAFEPATNVSIGEMLKRAEDAVGQTFYGYKGGHYTMDHDTRVWVSPYGSTTEDELELEFFADPNPPMSNDLNWKAWFKAWGDQNSLHVACRVGPGGLRTTPEEMYQAFKARLIEEQQEPPPNLRPGFELFCTECQSTAIRCRAIQEHEHQALVIKSVWDMVAGDGAESSVPVNEFTPESIEKIQKALDRFGQACNEPKQHGVTVLDSWRPIETAPKDGRWFLCYVPIEGHRQFLGFYSKDGLLLNDRALPAPFPPTHWMPLPAAPGDEVKS